MYVYIYLKNIEHIMLAKQINAFWINYFILYIYLNIFCNIFWKKVSHQGCNYFNKNTVKQQYCEILLKFKITVFYGNIF